MCVCVCVCVRARARAGVVDPRMRVLVLACVLVLAYMLVRVLVCVLFWFGVGVDTQLLKLIQLMEEGSMEDVDAEHKRFLKEIALFEFKCVLRSVLPWAASAPGLPLAACACEVACLSGVLTGCPCRASFCPLDWLPPGQLAENSNRRRHRGAGSRCLQKAAG